VTVTTFRLESELSKLKQHDTLTAVQILHSHQPGPSTHRSPRPPYRHADLCYSHFT